MRAKLAQRRVALGRATLGDLAERLAVRGDRIALTLEQPMRLPGYVGQRAVSYRQLADVVDTLARALAAAGLARGDRVAVCADSDLEYALTCFAAVRAGGVAVPLHHHLKPAEVAAFLERSRAKLLVCDAAVAGAAGNDVVTLVRGATLDAAFAAAKSSKASAKSWRPPKLSADEPALILYTSGTSGTPKGATLTSKSMLAVARLAALAPDVTNEHGVCGLPLAHVMGMSTLLLALIAGTSLHWISKFDAKVVLARIVERHASFFVGVPAMYALLAEAGPEDFDLSSVRLFASGADAMPPALVERFRKLGCAAKSPRGRKLLTAAFAEVYGMVELSGPVMLKLTPPAPFDDGPVSGPLRRALSRPGLSKAKATALAVRHALAGGRSDDDAGPSTGAFGIVIPPNRARVVDENGKPVKAGVVGELVVKGPGVTKGYDGDAASTSRATADGWLRTGDLAWKNRVGLFALATRKKDVIKHGGYSVFPAEVEAQLGAHKDVAEAIVFGIPHPTKGAVPAAAVVLARGAKVDEAALLAWSREHIAGYKAPRAIAIVDGASVPRNANRKVLKEELRASLLATGALQIAR